MSFKKGDKIVFNNNFGLDTKYPGVYTLTSDPWKVGETELVKVEAFKGGFRTDSLKKVE